MLGPNGAGVYNFDFMGAAIFALFFVVVFMKRKEGKKLELPE